MIVHHPADEMLVEYAGGSLAAAETLVVASHVAMCARCRHRVAELEALGAALLDEGETVQVDDSSLAAVLSRIDSDPPAEPAPARDRLDRETLALIPPPLRSLLDVSLSGLRWRRTGRGIEEALLPRYGNARISLLRIRAGQRVPVHTHSANEYTLVLSGGFADGGAHYGRGDLAIADGTVNHAPVADPDMACLCLTVQDGDTRLTGPIGRYLNPLVRRSA